MADVPAKPYSEQDLVGTYYYHYNIKDIVAMFNRGLADSWFAVGVSISNIADPDLKKAIEGAHALYFEYDYDKCRLVMRFDKVFYNCTCKNGTYELSS